MKSIKFLLVLFVFSLFIASCTPQAIEDDASLDNINASAAAAAAFDTGDDGDAGNNGGAKD